MAKRFNYKQFEMQMEDLVQESVRCSKEYPCNEGLATADYEIKTRGATASISIYALSVYDDYVNLIDTEYFEVEVWTDSGPVDNSGKLRGNEELRRAVARRIKNFRNQPEQIRWMEQRILESSVIDNGITTKTRRL